MGIVFSAIGVFLLKMLGAVLFLIGFLLLFILVMLCLVLFCPIRYKGAAEYDGNLTAKGRVTWFFFLLSVTFSYQEGEADSKIRILGIDLLKFLGKHQKRNTDSGKQTTETKKKSRKSKNKDKPFQNQPDLQVSQIEENFSEDTMSEDEKTENMILSEKNAMPDLQISEISEKETERAEKSKIRMFFQRIRELPQHIREKIKRFFSTLRGIFESVKSKAEWLSRIKEFWKSENTQGMVCIFKNNVLHLLRKIKPKVLRGTVFFGTGDPCATGRILGAAAVLYAVYGRGVQVVPDFEEARLEGELYVKGRLSLITIVFVVIKILISNEWKQFKYDFDQLKEAL